MDDHVELSIREVTQGQHWEVQVEVSADAPVGPILSRLEITTNDPDEPVRLLHLWGMCR